MPRLKMRKVEEKEGENARSWEDEKVGKKKLRRWEDEKVGKLEG
jgi:hypothetical protein